MPDDAAGNFENPRNAGVDVVEYWRRGAGVHSAVLDLRRAAGRPRGRRPCAPAGSNTLTTYLLPDLWYYVMGAVGFTWLEAHFHFGWEGVVKSVMFTLVMLGFAWGLTRARVRLQL